MDLCNVTPGQQLCSDAQVAERTAADKKGGHLCRRLSDGRFMLRESAMCPDEDKASFEDISKHKFFNTNNLWVNLPKLKVLALELAPMHPNSLNTQAAT